MSPSYLAVLRGVRELHRLTIEGRDESPEADAIRDATDAPWEALTDAERKRVSGLSEDLYSISEPADERTRPNNPQAQAKLIDASIARESGQWDRALALLRRWGEYVPPALLSYLRGSIWLDAGDPATATLFFDHAASLEPENGIFVEFLLHALDLANPEEALRRAEDILARDRSYAPAVVARACDIELRATRSAPDADASAVYRRLIPVLERALKRVEDDNENGVDQTVYALTIGLLGFSYEFLGDNQKAIQYYSQGLQLDPNDVALLTARGILLYGSSPGAVADFELAVRNGCPVVWPYYYLAHDYLVSGRFEECRAMCERGAHVPAPDSVRSELAEWKAISQAHLGFPIDMVRTSFEDALRLDPSNDRARRNLSLLAAAVRPIPSGAWETRRATAVRASGIAARRLERRMAA
jgi:tetratricopeptide (TPR) repeat protein